MLFAAEDAMATIRDELEQYRALRDLSTWIEIDGRFSWIDDQGEPRGSFKTLEELGEVLLLRKRCLLRDAKNAGKGS